MEENKVKALEKVREEISKIDKKESKVFPRYARRKSYLKRNRKIKRSW